MVIIKGYNPNGQLVWQSTLTMESYNRNRLWHEDDAKQHGAVRVVVDMAL